jgi:hypothetical protein
VALVTTLVLGACAKKPRNFETHVQLKTVEVVSREEDGTARIVEVSVEYPDCPGDQLETLQGDKAFTSCVMKYKSGDVLPAEIEWGPTDYGHYDSEITKLGDCPRKRDPRDARSYEVIQVCSEVKINGVRAGFHCDRKPNKELIAKCPWFLRQ